MSTRQLTIDFDVPAATPSVAATSNLQNGPVCKFNGTRKPLGIKPMAIATNSLQNGHDCKLSKNRPRKPAIVPNDGWKSFCLPTAAEWPAIRAELIAAGIQDP